MSSSKSDQQELRAEIREVREDLGATVEALAHKADVPARARERGERLRGEAKVRVARARQTAQQSPNSALLAVGSVLGLLVLIGLARSRRSRR